MYDKLARGHATAFLNRRQDYARVHAWEAGAESRRALHVLLDSARSKKPGRVLRRMRPVLRPVYHRADILFWHKSLKAVVAEAISTGQETEVLDITRDAAAPLFTERAVFLTNAILECRTDEAEVYGVTVGAICHHALQRLLERDLATPETLARHVRDILGLTRNVGLIANRTSITQEGCSSLLLPYGDGALAAVTMRVDPVGAAGSGAGTAGETRRDVIAIRTYLPASMLDDRQRARMDGFDTALGEIDLDDNPARAWVERNAVPWTIAPEQRAELRGVGAPS